MLPIKCLSVINDSRIVSDRTHSDHGLGTIDRANRVYVPNYYRDEFYQDCCIHETIIVRFDCCCVSIRYEKRGPGEEVIAKLAQ